MTDKPNEKVQIDRSGLTINTDPAADAAASAAHNKPADLRGVNQIGGGDHPKDEKKGVKIIGR